MARTRMARLYSYVTDEDRHAAGQSVSCGGAPFVTTIFTTRGWGRLTRPPVDSTRRLIQPAALPVMTNGRATSVPLIRRWIQPWPLPLMTDARATGLLLIGW